MNPEKHPTWIQKHQRKKRDSEDTSTVWKAWRKLDEENITLRVSKTAAVFLDLNTYLTEIRFLGLFDCIFLLHKIRFPNMQADLKSNKITLSSWKLLWKKSPEFICVLNKQFTLNIKPCGEKNPPSPIKMNFCMTLGTIWKIQINKTT